MSSQSNSIEPAETDPQEEEVVEVATELPNTSGTSEHWTDSIGDSLTCVNCGAPRLSAFCAECGQRHLTERLVFADLVKQIASRVFDLDRGLTRTFVDSIRQPGQVARDYVEGKQKPYVNPLTYFFIGAAAQILSLWFISTPLKTQITEGFQLPNSVAVSQDAPNQTGSEQAAGPLDSGGLENGSNEDGESSEENPSDATREDKEAPSQPDRKLTPAQQAAERQAESLRQLEELLGGDIPSVLADVYLSVMMQAYSYAAFLFFCIPFAVFLRLLHRTVDERFQLGETFVFSLFITAQMLIITAVLTSIVMRTFPNLQVIVGPAAYLVLAMHGHTGFFKSTWSSRLMTLLALVLSVTIFLAAIMGIFVVSFIFHVAMTARAVM